MAVTKFLVIFCFIGLVWSQHHLGPIGDPLTVECYTCGGHHHGDIPQCLSTSHTCKLDEVCEIKYGNGIHTEIKCSKADDCAHDIANPMRNCSGGGVEFQPNECKKCCRDTQCVSDITNLFKVESSSSDSLLCSGACTDNHLEVCVNQLHRCPDGEFCQVTKDDHGKTKGECKADHDYQHCLDELKRHPCPGGHKCYWDCCTTNDCLKTHFGQFWTTAAPMTTTTPMTTAGPATSMTTTQSPTLGAPGSLWTSINGKCEDQLLGDNCKMLMASQDICHDRLALSICPKSCGLCDAVNSTICKDTVVNNGCQTLKYTEDVCSDDLALFICPQTCNMCTELINSVITSILEGSSSSTDVPPTLLPTSVNPSDYPTFDCADLEGFDCVILNGLCGISFMKVVCPDRCKSCGNSLPTTPLPTTPMRNTDIPATPAQTTHAPTTAAPTTPVPTTTMPTTAIPTTKAPTTPVPTTPMPTTTIPTTKAPTTTASTTPAPTTPVPTTKAPTTVQTVQTTQAMSTSMPDTMAPTTTNLSVKPTQDGSTNGTCDNTSGLDCGSFIGICDSVIASTVCPKFCGLC